MKVKTLFLITCLLAGLTVRACAGNLHITEDRHINSTDLEESKGCEIQGFMAMNTSTGNAGSPVINVAFQFRQVAVSSAFIVTKRQMFFPAG